MPEAYHSALQQNPPEPAPRLPGDPPEAPIQEPDTPPTTPVGPDMPVHPEPAPMILN